MVDNFKIQFKTEQLPVNLYHFRQDLGSYVSLMVEEIHELNKQMKLIDDVRDPIKKRIEGLNHVLHFLEQTVYAAQAVDRDRVSSPAEPTCSVKFQPGKEPPHDEA